MQGMQDSTERICDIIPNNRALGSESFRYNTAMLFNLLQGQPLDSNITVTPSYFLKEMMISFEERFNQMKKLKFKKESFFPHYKTSKYFKATPHFIVLQSFIVGKLHTVPLEILSKAKVMKTLKLNSENNLNFTVFCTSKIISKVAPGMAVRYNINFFPNEERDYFYEIHFETENERFVVPILALSARPLLDFPDHIDVGDSSPVKIGSSKVLNVKNIGKVSSSITLKTHSPFSVEPQKTMIDAGNSVKITLKLFSTCIGDFSDTLIVVHENGEELMITLKGSVINAPVILDRSNIIYPLTFITLQERKIVRLINNSDHLIVFQWQLHASIEEDILKMEKMKECCELLKNMGTLKCNKLEYHGVIDKDCHANVYERIFIDEVSSMSSKLFEFHNKNFLILPKEGELWPHTSVEISFIFSPTEAIDYSCTAYCEVTGVEKRYPLELLGTGRGPDIRLCVNSLNILSMSLCSEKTFEVLIKNHGDIIGLVTHIPKPPVFGGKITCQPNSLTLMPDELKVFFITFSGTMKGDFVEEIQFLIPSSQQKLMFLLMGKVITPNIYFDKKLIEFGTVTLGFPAIERVSLINDSLVSVTFSLYVLSDGFEKSVTCNDFAAKQHKGPLPRHPKEFIIRPSKGTIDAGSCIPIEIELTANSARSFTTSLILDLVNTGETVMLTVKGSAALPSIDFSPKHINLPFCFINHSYHQSVKIENKSDVAGYFYIVPQEVTEERYLLYNFSVTEGMIEPHQTIMADLEVVVAQLGEHNDEVKLLLFGENDPNTVIYLHCDGQGPVVTVTPNQLDFGEVKLLESHSLQLRMVNDAPIPAEFCSYVELKNNYLITITPESGVIKPNSKLTLLVTLQLCDAGITTDNVSIKVQDSRSIVVHILAKGIGTSIVVEPAIYPVFDLGKLASLKHYVIPLKITNHSSKLHTLYWTRDPKCRSQIIQNENVNWKNFKFEPNKLDVLAQQTTSINLHIFSSVDREIAETFYNFAAISNRGSRFVLGTSTIKVAFISTGITVSEANLYFRIDVTPMVQKVVPKRDTVTIYNETDIDAVLLVWTSPPFFLLDHNGAETKEINLHFDKNSDTVITILFDPGSDQRCVSTVYNGILNILFRDSKDELPLTGEVNYPNISLSQEKIDFGYVPVGSGAVAIFTLLNTGVLPATYFWEVSGKWNKLNLPEYEESSCLCCSVRRTSIIPCNYVKGVHQIYSNNEKEIHNIVPFTNKNYVKKKLMICKDASIVRNKLYCLMEHCVSEIDEEKIETDFLQNLPLPEATDIDQVLDILPVAGILDGKSSQMVTVGFWPSPGTTYNLNACCHIVGGPKQFLTIDGGSSFIRFSVDKCLINFGCCTYCDEHVNSVTLKNLGEISIHFEIEVQEDIKKELLRVKRSSLEFSCSEFNTGLFFVEPCKGTLGPNDSVTFNVTYYPSVSLELDSSFSIQVNHLNPFIVKVKGYGVMPQVSINLPRSPMPRIPIRLMYFAIGQLTSSFFASKKSSNNIEEPSEEFKDWVFIGFQDDIPSISDIDLALERALVYVFTKDPSAFRHNYGLKAIIQGITVPEYILDFGYVVVETTVYQTVIIRNGGLCPLPSVHILLPLQKKVLNNKNDLNIEYKKVEKSEDIMIIATLFPRICNYDGRPQNLNVTVFVEVPDGLRIPIRLIGIITLPCLSVSSRTLFFKDILVGEKKSKQLMLKNEGNVPCTWEIALKSNYRLALLNGNYNSTAAFSFNIKNGYLELDEKQMLSIHFQPTRKGKFDDYLFINIKSNPEPIRIHLLGHGVEPSLEISEQFLDFEATFPFPENYAKYITIRNTGKMPIEIYFTDFDKLVLKEDAALRILCLLYNTSELYLTHEQFSTSLSPKVLDLYDELVKRVPLENNGIEEDTDSSVTVQTQLLLQDDEVRKPSEFSKDVILATDSSLQFELNDIANLHSRIYDYVAAHQEQFVEFLSNIDSQSFFYRETPETEQDQVNEDEIGGDVVIFHGAPSVDYVVWANKAATKLSFVAKTIDEIILQELIDSRSQTAVRVRQLIEEAYFFLVVDNSPDLQAEFTEGKMAVNDDPYYELLRKFDILLMLKEENNKKSAGKKGTAKSTVKSAGTAKKDKKPEYNYAPLLYMDSLTFMNIPLNDFKDILLAGLQKVKGVVIETLHSFFINDTITALLILLISCSYQNVYFVSIFDSVKSFMKRHEEEQKTLEENDRNEKERKINEMDEMSADEFDNLDDDSKKLFRNEKLAERRRIFHNKKIEMKSRPNSKESSKAGKTVEKSKQKKDGTPKSKKEKSQPGTKKSIPKAIADNPVLTEIISKFGAYEKELEIILSVLETWNKHDTVDVNELSKKLSSWNTSSKKNKGETKMTKETSVEVKDTPSNENQSQPENLGIPMWIFNYKKNYCHDIRRFGDCVLQNKSKVEIGHYEGSSFLPKLQSLYLAVKKPDNRVLLLHANEFTIVNVDQASLLGTPETSHLSKSSLVQHSGREKIKQVNQKHSKSPSKSLTMKGGISRRKLIQTPKNSDIVKLDSDTAPGFFQPRVLLEPNQIQTWKICFTPQTFGYFEDEFVIEVARGRKQYTIKCSGICDIPRVDTDPTVIFPLVLDSFCQCDTGELVFIRRTEKFYFGPVMVKENRSESDFGLETYFKFVNISKLDVEMTIAFYDEEKEDIESFNFKPRFLKIESDTTKKLRVRACPRSSGTHSATLVYSIKNNPEPRLIKLSCIGVKPEFSYDPKILLFERVLLHRKDAKVVLLINNCFLPLKWMFIGAMTFDPDIVIQPPCGIIEPLTVKKVYFEYFSSYVQNVQKSITLEVYDTTGLQELLYSGELQVKIDSYDVLIDIMFNNSGDKFINFDRIKIEQTVSKTFSIKNKGNYSTSFSIKLEKVPGITFDPNEIFKVTPLTGNLGPSGKSVTVQVSCLCLMKISLKESPIIKITVIDKLSEDSLVAVIPVCISVKSYYSSYVIAPEYDINFGPMHLSSKKELLIHIANTGVFDFQYTFIDVLNPPDGTLQIEGVKKTGEKGKSKEKTETPGSSKKKKEKNQGVQPLVIGSFTIPKPSGILEPGCSINVPVQCNFPTLGEIIADIRILISESKIKNGIPMKLLAHGSVSQIDFKNTDFIFQDATLCDSTHDLIPFEKIKEETSFYIKNQNKLIFFNTTVGATASLDLHLHNSELLTTGVSCKITSDNSCFSVFPTNENICPYSTKHIKLSFSPVNLEMMNGLLEISAGNTIMTTKLQGEGVFPQIEIINPPNLNQESDNVAFLPTLLNTYSNQELSFKNTGSVTCRVMLELYENEENVFSLSPTSETLKFIKLQDDKVGMQHTTLVVLQPNSVAEFSVMFTPISVKTYRCEIKLHIAGNPYENLSVIFIGCGYMDDVIFDIERLTLKEMAKLMTKESLQELFSQFTVISCYCYNLGYCYISFPKERTLKMLNISATSVYRYEWNEKEGFTISPRMGFIAPGDFAELLINFVSDESKLPDFVVYLICNLTKVEISEGSVTEFENKVTDDQETVITASTDDLLPETVEEVKYKRVEGTWQVILLKVTGVVDLPEPVCNNSTITFDDTLLFESAEYIIDINNSGSVPLMYEWNIRSYIPITVEKKNVWKENCASLLSIGTSRPKSFPKFNAKSVDRPMTAQTIRHRSSTLRGPRPISSSASLITITPNVVTKKDSTSSEHDYEACVFSVSPTRGTIDPLGSEKFVFKFTPLQLLHYTAKFVMMLSHSPLNNNKLIVVEVSGIGIMPLCHFIINETDCLLTRTYQPTMEIEPHTKILEISVLGVGLPITKKFDILNPTANIYSFVWEKYHPFKLSQFTCNTISGYIQPGKQMEVSFSFLPHSAGTYESLWKLIIPELHLIQPVLFVGRASDPKVHFSTVHIHMKPTLIGVKGIDYVNLINAEKVDLDFKIEGNFLHGEESVSHHIVIDPMSGIVSAESECELRLEITPKYAGEEMFLVKCAVKKCKDPLQLYVHIHTYAVLPVLIHEISSKQNVELVHSKTNHITLENMTPRIPQSLTFIILNMGKPSIIYKWEENEEHIKHSKVELCFSKKTGIITCQSKEYISLNFTALSKITFKDILVTLKISKGPQYNILFSGTAEIPIYEFSFYEYNFGPCFVCTLEDSVYKALLCVTNKDEDLIVVETSYKDSEYLHVVIPQNGVVKPRSVLEVIIIFTPQEEKKYKENIQFIVNGTYNHKVTIVGHGQYIKIGLAKASDKMINFGVVLVGQTVKRSVAIVNKTPASAEIFLTATSPNENKYVTIEPSVPKLIKPHGSVKFYFNFSPRTLIKTSFTIQVFLHCLNIVEPLCILKGYCIGPEFSLDRDYIPFGCVVLGCSSSVKFLLLNTGDIGSKFSWSCSKEEYTSWIVIEPSFGYISPGSEITLNVRFTPDSPISYFRTEVICNLESFKKLKLVITGSCVSVDPPSTPINFSCPVRKSDFQKVTLHNPNGDMWTVCPVFKGKEFKGSQTVIINALNDAQYEIEYSPLTMTSETEKHMGTVFFPFPDGSCKLFSLKGDALPPQVEDVVLWTIPAKVNVNKTLSLTNWLQIPQRFVMSSEVIEKGNPDPIFTLSGSKYIDVGASQNRIYNLSLHCYRESKVKLKIYFTNESLQQYMWFDIRVNVVPPLDLATYTLKTRVRLTTYQTIPLINPLSKPLKFHLSSSELSITAQESPVTIEGLQKGEIVILYTPLFPETGREILISVLSEALGPFPYKLLLNAGNPVPEDTIVISAEIGRNVTVPLDVINMSTVKTEFVCMPDHSDLSIASSVSADPGKHAILNIVYEPSSIGTITRLLTVNSTDAGAFYFPIVATGCLPKPSGPHILKPGETIEFKIKNVFNTQKQYSSLVDSPAFIVKNPTLEIQPKKEEKIRVQMLPKNELGNFTFPEFPITGKLSVVLLSESSTTSDSVDLLNNQISWPFYLKGIIN